MRGAPLGLNRVCCEVGDLAGASAWYSARLRAAPQLTSTDQARFGVGGLHLALLAASSPAGAGGSFAVWRVEDLDATLAEWVRHGAVVRSAPHWSMTGERTCRLQDPFGVLVGLAEEPAP
ncbi:VOC family protein [Kineococcus gypseus]|uniref:VOC family protein n=1 Tax=Kineococcus gypseus TaxID=1637102 RepID=UPI003D7EE1C1